MIASKITTRYAKSLLDLAIETNQLKECYNDLLAVEALCSKSNDFSLMLKSPIINTSKKLSILKSLFENKLSKTTYLFVELITKKKENLFFIQFLKTSLSYINLTIKSLQLVLPQLFL